MSRSFLCSESIGWHLGNIIAELGSFLREEVVEMNEII
jgi:hypothetical protein